MDTINKFLDIHQVFFQIFGYPISFIEFAGTILGLISVWLATKANIHTWSTGIVNILAFFVIYYQVQLYSDMLLQVYFFIMSIYGWIIWKKRVDNVGTVKINFIRHKERILYLLSIMLLCILIGFVISNVHNFMPNVFSKPAAYPYADAVTTVLSIFATVLMANKKIECWILWIIVDIVSITLYLLKGIVFVSIEYSIFLVLAIIGFFDWLKYFKYAKRNGTGQVYATP